MGRQPVALQRAGVENDIETAGLCQAREDESYVSGTLDQLADCPAWRLHFVNEQLSPVAVPIVPKLIPVVIEQSQS